MTTIHTGNTTTTGFTVMSDATGNLVIKTGGAGGTTAVTVGADQRVTFAQPPLTAAPAFFVLRDGDKNLTTGIWQTADLNAVIFDTNSWYNTNTFRYTPQIAGYYQFSSSLYLRAASSMGQISCAIGKNGTTGVGILGDLVAPSSGSAGSCSAGGLLYMNGSTDYVESLCYMTGSSPYLEGTDSAGTALGTVGKVYGSFLSGFLVRAA